MNLRTVNQIISYIVPFPLTVVNLIVIWLTWYKVRPCLSRTFAFNMTIPSLGYDLYLIMLDILGILKLDGHFGFRTGDDVILLDYVTDFVLYYCNYAYRTLAILIVTLTYVSFTKPALYKKLNHPREMSIMFATCHILAILTSFAATTAPNRAALKYLAVKPFDSSVIPITVLEVVTGSADLFTFAILVVFYLASIKAILTFKHRNAKLGISSSEKLKKVQNQLHATLVFITPPSIFLIPNSVCINLLFAVTPVTTPVLDQVCEVKIELFATLLSIRLFLASAMLLIAFGDYRRALVGIVCKCKTQQMFTISNRTTVIHTAK